MVNQFKTGIPGLDAMLYGGIPEKNQVLVSGGPGAGKTLLGFEYAYRNAKAGRKSVMFALEEDPKAVIANAKTAFPELTDIDQLIESKQLVIDSEASTGLYASDSESSEYSFGRLIAEIESIITQTGAKAMVLDSISLLDVLMSDKISYRRSMMAMTRNLKRLGVTSLLIAEMGNPDRAKLRFKPEFFIFDGIIIMYQTGDEAKRMPAIEVIKMRGAKHSFVTTPYDISPAGFRILAAEDVSAYG